MKRIILPYAVLTTTFALAVPAQAALLTRTFVSSAGSDSNPCTITQPCATLAQAYSLTAANGIIAALDPGKYGPLTITEPITINGNGWAAITAPASGNGITVNAGASDGITLTGLEIDGAGAGQNGIVFNTGGSLTVENCVIRNAVGAGIYFIPSGTNGNLAVSYTFVANNGGTGIHILPTGISTVMASFNHVEANNNGKDGIHVDGSAITSGGLILATVVESVAASNGRIGFHGASNGISQTGLNLFHAVATHNATTAVEAEEGAQITLEQSVLEGSGCCTTFIVATGGAISSYGDNYITWPASGTGSLSSISKQ